jgi:hypothetical protein
MKYFNSRKLMLLKVGCSMLQNYKSCGYKQPFAAAAILTYPL